LIISSIDSSSSLAFCQIAQSIAKRSLGALLCQPDTGLQDMQFMVFQGLFNRWIPAISQIGPESA